MSKSVTSPLQTFRATYRLQLDKDFKFQAATKITKYLQELGVSHLYLSPVLEAREGSNHGYDGIDPTRISEERGGEKALDALFEKVRQLPGLEGVILDIVPNHLGADPKNPAWWDLLKHGTESKFWNTFDVRARGDNDLRVVLPVLGRPRSAALANREIKIGLQAGELIFKYYEHPFPMAWKSYPRLLEIIASELEKQKIKWSVLPTNDGETAMKELAQWLQKNPKQVSVLNKIFGQLSVKIVEDTLAEQHYSLKDWRTGNLEVNYRRFFDINDLAAIRVEDPAVFQWAHSKIEELVQKHDVVHGLRVDHVDGLTMPGDYLDRLNTVSEHVWVEKILGDGEKIPAHWKIKGSTGYEFSNISARLFVHLPGLMHLHSHYVRHIDNRWERFHDCVYDSKREMLESHFVSEINYITGQFYRVASASEKALFTRDELLEALTELTSSMRIYRTYATRGEALQSRFLEEALAETEGRGKLPSKNAFNWLRETLLAPGNWDDDTFRTIKRWEQLTGPIMAKGVEDTALYRYCPLLSLNVVGGEPDWIGDGSMEYHSFNQDKLRNYPLAMSTTSTHDTKRSEDVRSRIHTISELSDEWLALFQAFRKNRSKKFASTLAVNTEYLICETLIGAWPTDGKITDAFIERLQRYYLKAVREAKTETSWTEPNLAYEKGLQDFVNSFLRPKDEKGRSFLKKLKAFAEKCAYFGSINSLSLVTLKALSPGLPDFYQGCEMWDLSLVDPDNRRPIDYEFRQELLKKMKESLKKKPSAYHLKIATHWKTGEIKLWLTWELLKLRQQNPELFTAGEYLALEARGEFKSNFIAFLRHHGDEWILVIVPRFLASHQKVTDKLEIKNPKILETEFVLPENAPDSWKHVWTGASINGRSFKAKDIFGGLPIAVLSARGNK